MAERRESEKSLDVKDTQSAVNWSKYVLRTHIPSKFFLSDPVVLVSTCYRTRAKRLINESNTTGGLKKLGRDATGYRGLVLMMVTQQTLGCPEQSRPWNPPNGGSTRLAV